MIYRIFFTVSIGILSLNSIAQNLVPNSSFEEIRNLPIRENPKKYFMYEPKSGYIPYQRNLNYWFAATDASPDLRIGDKKKYGECKRRYDDCDKAHTGNNSVGIMTYLINDKTDTYREYVQIKLKQRLKPNIETYIEIWVAKEREAKLSSNNIGCYFSMERIKKNTMGLVGFVPQVNYDTIINANKKEWFKIALTFTPKRPFEYLLIGNFYSNDRTATVECKNFSGWDRIRPYAYYMLDDIRVWQKGDKPEDYITIKEKIKPIKKNAPIQLKNIVFEHNSAVLKSSSFDELNELVTLLKNRPTLKIGLQGHTDNRGNEAYNQKLSEARVKAVYDYLIEKAIAQNRLTYQGFGESQPIADNETEQGRLMNRRVEFVVLQE